MTRPDPTFDWDTARYDDENGDPLCDVWGDCEPHDADKDQTEAHCMYCGGWRYRDYPDFGNWGVWDNDLERTWVHRDAVLDTTPILL